jgi:hypothetical protein
MLETKKTRRRLEVLVVVSVLSSVVFLWTGYRNEKLNTLFREASGIAPDFKGTEQAGYATREIGSYSGDTAKNMLYQIASGDTAIVWPSIQTQALEELKRRNDPRISEILAGFLQPHVLIDTRKAAAQSLQSLPCDRICTIFVLQYLQRIYDGEPNYEDRGRESFGSDIDKKVKADLAVEQQSIYSILIDKLMANSQLTNSTLRHVYGLGTEAPASFALDFVAKANDKDACPTLISSKEYLSSLPEDSFVAPRDKLDKAIRLLQCAPSPK